MSTPAPETGSIPDVSKLAPAFAKLQSDLVVAKADLASAGDREKALTAQLTDAVTARDEAVAELDTMKSSRAAARTRSVAVDDGSVHPGDLVTFAFTDVLTGDQLSGPAVVVTSGQGGLTIAPVSRLPLTLGHESVTPVPADVLAPQGD